MYIVILLAAYLQLNEVTGANPNSPCAGGLDEMPFEETALCIKGNNDFYPQWNDVNSLDGRCGLFRKNLECFEKLKRCYPKAQDFDNIKQMQTYWLVSRTLGHKYLKGCDEFDQFAKINIHNISVFTGKCSVAEFKKMFDSVEACSDTEFKGIMVESVANPTLDDLMVTKRICARAKNYVECAVPLTACYPPSESTRLTLFFRRKVDLYLVKHIGDAKVNDYSAYCRKITLMDRAENIAANREYLNQHLLIFSICIEIMIYLRT